MTDISEPCSLPFTWKGLQYSTCIVNGPNNTNYLPQCLTSTGKWANCIGKKNSLLGLYKIVKYNQNQKIFF
jgi:hypothetical protein